MKSSSNILLILLFAVSKAIACECGSGSLAALQESSYENSDCIFIGEVIDINGSDSSFAIKVVESLDGGDEVGNIYQVVQQTSCDLFTESKGKWIVYGNTIEDGNITMNLCLLNRPFNKPISFATDQSQKKDEDYESYLERAKEILNLEIIALREKRDL